MEDASECQVEMKAVVLNECIDREIHAENEVQSDVGCRGTEVENRSG